MDIETLQKMLELEEQELRDFNMRIMQEMAFRQGRIKLLVELLKKEEEIIPSVSNSFDEQCGK